MKVKDLKPELIWGYFDKITTIPRPSYKEEKILAYLASFARENNFKYRSDSAGNLVIYAPASKGKESCNPIILQNHVDMVCEKLSDIDFDFDNNLIPTFVEDGWVKTRGTTLGADCGIGVAAVLALLTDSDVQHPPIEALFTVNEESGLVGARELDYSMLSAKRLLNLDAGVEGEFFIGCAGGVDTIGYFPAKREVLNENSTIVEIAIKGLNGGHSGDDINKSRANAVVLMCRFLASNIDTFGINLIDIDGGNLRNAIPHDIRATLAVDSGLLAQFYSSFNTFADTIKREYAISEPNIEFLYAESTKTFDRVVCMSDFRAVVNAIFTMPCGVMAMSQDIEGFVESSTNIASIKIKEEQVVVQTSQRSSVESKRDYISAQVSQVMKSYGASVVVEGAYPGWNPNSNSSLLELLNTTHIKLLGKSAEIKAVHAGLECGLFAGSMPQLDMVSIGPTMLDIHSPYERLDIESTNRFYQLLCDFLSNC